MMSVRAVPDAGRPASAPQDPGAPAAPRARSRRGAPSAAREGRSLAPRRAASIMRQSRAGGQLRFGFPPGMGLEAGRSRSATSEATRTEIVFGPSPPPPPSGSARLRRRSRGRATGGAQGSPRPARPTFRLDRCTPAFPPSGQRESRRPPTPERMDGRAGTTAAKPGGPFPWPGKDHAVDAGGVRPAGGAGGIGGCGDLRAGRLAGGDRLPRLGVGLRGRALPLPVDRQLPHP